MIIDKQNLMSYKQVLTVTANSTDVIDLGPPLHTGASGNGGEIPIFMHVDAAFTAAGAATLVVEIKSSTDEARSQNVKTHAATGVIAKTDLAQPKRMPLNLILPADVQRYVWAVYTVATGPFLTGTITLGVTAGRQTNY